jgi:hypothetical protein
MAEQSKESWIQWVALTTTILAVCAAISSLRASSYSTRVQISTTKEANQWAYYQSKSIKENTYQSIRDILVGIRLLEAKNPKAHKFLSDKIKKYDEEIGRYEKEKAGIKKDAENIAKEQEVLKKKNSEFALAVMLLQIAIMASAVGALIKKKLLWFVGLAVGIWGLVYMAIGFV